MRRVRDGLPTMRMTILLLSCMLAAMPVSGQQEAKPKAEPPSQPGVGQKPSNVAATKPGEFYDKDLDLHFNYPVEMRTLDASAEMESGHQNIYGVCGENDPEHQKAKRCVRALLDAELPEDKAPQRAASLDGVWVDDSKEYKESRKPEPIFAKILLMELIRDCLPKKLLKNENDALGSMALSFVSEPWIQRMPKPLWYEVGKQKIHMNSGVGRPIINGQTGSRANLHHVDGDAVAWSLVGVGVYLERYGDF